MLEEEYQPRRQLPPHLRPAPAAEPEFSYSLRAAQLRDLPSIREIYNLYVRNSSVTFGQEPLTIPALRKKFETIAQRGYPFIVAESPNEQLLGFAYVQPWNARASNRFSVENHIYLGPAATSKGLGTALLGELIERSRLVGIKVILAVIADKGADASIRLHESFGYKTTGHMGKVGFKYDRWLGSVLMELKLKK
jgi:L-amino acid N-acyltransferase YncA